MLEFNPYYRPSAKQLLKSQVFDEIRTEKVSSPDNIALKFKLDTKDDIIDYDQNNYRDDLKTKMLQSIVDEYKKV